MGCAGGAGGAGGCPGWGGGCPGWGGTLAVWQPGLMLTWGRKFFSSSSCAYWMRFSFVTPTCAVSRIAPRTTGMRWPERLAEQTVMH